MIRRARSLFRVTAVRLSIIYTIIFGILAVGIVVYITGATVNVLRQQLEESIDQEIAGLSRVYNTRGLRSLITSLERRARAPGANLYVVTDAQGEIIAGNVPSMEAGVMRRIGWTGRPFRYYRYGDSPEEDHRAIARIVEVPNGLRILVGRDIGEHEKFRDVVGKGFKLAIGTMLALGILTWFFVGRRALKRIDGVSKSTARIMAGDRTERLPVTGTGDEFDRLSENLNHMLDRIDQLNDGVKQMSDNIAHDLKTPITRLRNKADEVIRINDPEDQRQKMTDIIADCDQIVRTFDALLMISRVESGSSVAKMGSVDLGALFTDLHELYEAVAEEAGAVLTLDMDTEVKRIVHGNRELLSQAFSNLIDNALKYGSLNNAPLQIRLSCQSKGVEFLSSVSDNGPGIPLEERKRVLKRFVRLDESRKSQGNGLGLSLVQAIVNLHGGKLLLEDNKPGLTVSINLPVKGEMANE